MIKVNKDKNIGRVLFIVEGEKTEFSLLRKIFCDILGYNYLEQSRRENDFLEKFENKNNKYSKVAVINDECLRLTDYGVNVRYPFHFDLTESDMELAIKDATKIKEFILKQLNN